MWCTKSQFFDSPSAYGAKRSSNGRRDLPKLSSKCIPKHQKSTTKMHRSAIYTHRERENRWFHRCRKSNENMNYKIACFSLPCVRIGLQWSPAPSKKCWKFIKKQQIFFKNRVGSTARLSGRVVGQSYARFKAEIELHNIRTTTEHDSQPPTVHFGFLCPAAATCARIDPENPPHRFARWIKRVQGGSRILGLLMSRSIFKAPYRQLPQARCLLDCPFQKLGSRMDAPIFVFYRDWKFHTFGAYFNR